MQKLQDNSTKYETLLKEILIIPSTEIKESRFTDSETYARCHGTCDSGVCKTFVSPIRDF